MLLLLLLLLLIPSVTLAQVVCFRYADSLSCDGPNNTNRTITEFSPGMGIITDERGRVEPYTIIPQPQERRRSVDEAIRPLRRLDEPRRDSFGGRSVLDRSVLDRWHDDE